MLWRYRSFSIFKMAAVRHFGFSFFFLILCRRHLGGPICIAMPSFIKIAHGAEILYLTFFKMIFFKFDFLNSW